MSQGDVLEDLRDWDARFRAWQRDPRSPITPLDEITPWAPAFSTRSIADVKRSVRSAERSLTVDAGDGR